MTKTEEAWGFLKRIDGNFSSIPVKLTKDQYTFGRADDCDFKFSDNKFLSTKHCLLEKDKIDKKKVWFIDQSSNGSILNLKEKIHKNKKELVHKDEIYLVYRKNEPEKNIIYRFELLAKLPAVFDATQLYNCGEDLVFDNDDDDTNFKSPQPTCSKNLENLPKKNKLDLNDQDDSVKNKKIKNDIEEKEEKEEKMKTDEKKLSYDKNEPNDTVEKKPDAIPKKTQNSDIDLTDNMTCTICNEIMHDCISLQPCLHSYCAGCYSDWMIKSDECPVCRKKVERISKNHLINNIIEAYLKNNPDKKRSEQDLKLLNEKNKITHDMLYPKKDGKAEKYKDDYEDSEDEDLKKKKPNPNDSDSSSSDSDSDRGSIFRSDNEGNYENYGTDNDEDEEEYYRDHNDARDPDYVPPVGFAYANPVGLRPNYFHPPPVAPNYFNQPFRFTCRQCPQNKLFFPGLKAPDYTCTPFQNHIICQCCLEAFPDRNNEIARDPLLPKQNCSMCFKSYCNLYWGCNKGGCKKCLVKFNDLQLTNDCLNGLINDNQYESQLFSDWLVRSNKTIQQVFDECIEKLKNGEYKVGNLNANNTLDKIVCYTCGISLFKELAYQYRKDIPKKDIFNNANPRPDCYWGKECRTQKHNQDHSKRYNHICEKTKQA